MHGKLQIDWFYPCTASDKTGLWCKLRDINSNNNNYNKNDSDQNKEFIINDQLLLETILMMIRGETIKYSSFKKKKAV